MNEKILKTLENAINDNRVPTRRRFPRRMTDICVAAVDGVNYPVHDWSQCGVLFEADGRTFEDGSEHDVTMKFKLSDVVTEIPVRAKVIRAGKTKIALEFVNVSKKIQQAFSKVIEDAANMKKDAETGNA
ncbi:MAG: PilZ domain-containing protein [Alphaproteobacteria bacterium]|nr:PilZ domain-containing protein [Alphaproteobacteria bacterium]